MKLLVLLSLTAVLSAAPLQSVKSVYLFPMANGLDQFLANEIAKQNLFQVVSDPKLADAVFTDRLGASFERTFDQRVLGLKVEGDPAREFSGRARGTLFLVSKGKQVLWSAYEPPKDSRPKQVERAARRAAETLQEALAPPVVKTK